MKYKPIKGESLKNYLNRCRHLLGELTKEQINECILEYRQVNGSPKYRHWEPPVLDYPGEDDYVVEIKEKTEEEKK